jgi:hypothetical protein
MIPDHSADGALPPGIHDADDWSEVVSRFGGTAQRNALLAKLRLGLDNLLDAGCPWVLLDGSFVTNKPDPDDVDGCWEIADVDLSRLDPCFLPRSIAQKLMQRFRYGMDFYRASSIEDRSGKPFPIFFQIGKDGRARGIVRFELFGERA